MKPSSLTLKFFVGCATFSQAVATGWGGDDEKGCSDYYKRTWTEDCPPGHYKRTFSWGNGGGDSTGDECSCTEDSGTDDGGWLHADTALATPSSKPPADCPTPLPSPPNCEKCPPCPAPVPTVPCETPPEPTSPYAPSPEPTSPYAPPPEPTSPYVAPPPPLKPNGTVPTYHPVSPGFPTTRPVPMNTSVPAPTPTFVTAGAPTNGPGAVCGLGLGVVGFLLAAFV